MRKVLTSLMAIPMLAAMPASPVMAAIGPDAAQCNTGDGPALLVRVSGFKNRNGTVRVRTFAGNMQSSWFDKKRALRRVLVDLPDSGVVDVCVAVPRAGPFVVDVRHDINGNKDSDRSDGAGVSGNPNVSVFDFFIGKKPPASKVVVNATAGVTVVPITMKYIQGGSFKAVTASR
jgi:uncharacterized protein (DUF2141 family)